MSQSDLQLADFSRNVGDTLQETIEFYPQLFMAAVAVAQMPPSPSAESELMDIRSAASDWADTMAILSRNITNLSPVYQASTVGQEKWPAPVRPLLLDIMESCLLLAHVGSLGELSELSIMTPEDLFARTNHPQVSAWISHNSTVAMQQPMPAQALPQPPANSPAPPPLVETAEPTSPYPSPPAEAAQPSPYPSVEPVQPSPYPSVEPATPTQPAVPTAPPEPVTQTEPVPEADPWNQPPARPSTEGDRSRNKPV